MAEPGKYLAPKPTLRAESVAPGTIYTCPMHPQIRQDGLGSCPICGMALEPETPTAETGPNPELVDFTRRFWIGLVLTLPVFVLEMGGHLTGILLSPVIATAAMALSSVSVVGNAPVGRGRWRRCCSRCSVVRDWTSSAPHYIMDIR